jgi:voltage-gated potassium channel
MSVRGGLLEREAQRIARSRFVIIGIGAAMLVVAVVCGLLIRLTDPHEFPSIGTGVWWAVETLTTVGYGDYVPKSDLGRVVGGLEMILGITFFSFLTAVVTSTLIEHQRATRRDADHDDNTQAILDAIARLEERLDAPSGEDG